MGTATDLALALDPTELARIYLKAEPDDWQKEALLSDHPRQLFNCCRQSGKSSVAAVASVWTALYKPGSLTLMVSRTLDHSGELFKKAVDVYRQAGRPVEAKSETQLTLTLANGSRIVSRPGANDAAVRGYSATLLVIDEASQVSDALYNAATPVLAVTGGKIIALSTPYGRRGWWFEEWMSDRDWQRFRVTAPEVPRISPEFLEEERARKGQLWYRQEYLCSFKKPRVSSSGPRTYSGPSS